MSTEETTLYPSPSSLVREFHETYGQPVRTTPVFDVPERFLRINLILEEAVETVEAQKAKDFIEIVDGLADLVYVAYGAALTHGLNLDESFNTTTSPVYNLATAMAASRAKIRPLPTSKVFTLVASIKGIERLAVKYSQEGLSEQGTAEGLRATLVSLVSACYSTALSIGVDLDGVLAEVHSSNMSKLGADGKPIYSEEGKVLKGPDFFRPDIARVLKEQEPLL